MLVEFQSTVVGHPLLHIAPQDLAGRVDHQGILGVLIADPHDRIVQSIEKIRRRIAFTEIFAHGEHGRTLTHDLTHGKR
jgi:hypothetical protein